MSADNERCPEREIERTKLGGRWAERICTKRKGHEGPHTFGSWHIPDVLPDSKVFSARQSRKR